MLQNAALKMCKKKSDATLTDLNVKPQIYVTVEGHLYLNFRGIIVDLADVFALSPHCFLTLLKLSFIWFHCPIMPTLTCFAFEFCISSMKKTVYLSCCYLLIFPVLQSRKTSVFMWGEIPCPGAAVGLAHLRPHQQALGSSLQRTLTFHPTSWRGQVTWCQRKPLCRPLMISVV